MRCNLLVGNGWLFSTMLLCKLSFFQSAELCCPIKVGRGEKWILSTFLLDTYFICVGKFLTEGGVGEETFSHTILFSSCNYIVQGKLYHRIFVNYSKHPCTEELECMIQMQSLVFWGSLRMCQLLLPNVQSLDIKRWSKKRKRKWHFPDTGKNTQKIRFQRDA